MLSPENSKMKKNKEIALKCLEGLKKNNFDGYYFPTGKEAVEHMLENIPPAASVGLGDSTSVRQIGLLRALHDRGQKLSNPFSDGDPDAYEFPRTAAAHQAMIDSLSADYFIAGINALTMDGKIVNNDVGGNRVAGIIFGPKLVRLIAGTNKIVTNTEAALERLKKVAAPRNARRLVTEADMERILGEIMQAMGKTVDSLVAPCGLTGECVDCDTCMLLCYTTIIGYQLFPRIEIILIGEELGL